VGWGYNTNRYARTDIHFTQPTLGSDFTLHDVRFHDSSGLMDLFTSGLDVPQYNFQFGYYLRKNVAVELKFIHAKAIVTQGQSVQATGTLGGAQIDSPLVLDTETLRYQLNNGANSSMWSGEYLCSARQGTPAVLRCCSKPAAVSPSRIARIRFLARTTRRASV